MGGGGGPAFSQSPDAVGDIVIVEKPTKLCIRRGTTIKYSQVLPRKTLLQIAPFTEATSRSEFFGHFARVRSLGPTPGQTEWTEGVDQGWVWRCDILNLSAFSRDELERLRPDAISREEIDGRPATQTRREIQEKVFSTLVQRQPPEFQQAWRENEVAVAANEQLPAPQPEPYFTRAAMLRSIGDQETALRDFLTAATLVKNSTASKVNYAQYFLKLHESLRSRTDQPRPLYYGAAWQHYARGYHAFWNREWDTALQHFDNAIQLGPDVALFYYYRALTHKRLGKNGLANSDAIAGVHLEHRLHDPSRAETPIGTPPGSQTPQDVLIATQLERVQGSHRIWLEDFRSGVAAARRPDSQTSPISQEHLQ